jgi:hypothetical protein
MKPVLAASILIFAIAGPTFAQERIVVTGSRIRQEIGADYVIPQVGVERRADFLIRTLTVSCDTREEAARIDELRRTLRGMLTTAGRSDDIELSKLEQIDPGAYNYDYDANLGDNTLVLPFTEAEVDGPMLEGYQGRADTSYVQLLVKTPIREDDTLASAVARIESYVEAAERVGRSALDLDILDSLSVVDPAEYRDEIFATMSADAQARIAALGDGYRARFTGLENQVSWYRSDVLELTLFIPHTLEIGPAS